MCNFIHIINFEYSRWITLTVFTILYCYHLYGIYHVWCNFVDSLCRKERTHRLFYSSKVSTYAHESITSTWKWLSVKKKLNNPSYFSKSIDRRTCFVSYRTTKKHNTAVACSMLTRFAALLELCHPFFNFYVSFWSQKEKFIYIIFSFFCAVYG